MPKKPSILLIYTGGTIGMVNDPRKKTLSTVNFEQINKQVPELGRFGYTIKVRSFDPPIDSSNMNPGIWAELATLIGEEYENHDGFVILHGSDTMAYTASALSFMLENLGKPVILTGSQLPIGEIRTDAKENLITAVEIAAGINIGHVLVPEVCIFFDYQLYRGNRTSKYNSAKFEAFQSVNYPTLAQAGVHIEYNKEVILPKPSGNLIVHTKLDTSIAVIRLFPGLGIDQLKAVLSVKGLRAIVLEAFGAGNAPTDKAFLDLIRGAVKNEIIIYDVTQCGGGSVELGRYETSLHLKEMGVISGKDITTESAIVKLMYLLGKYSGKEKIEKELQISLRGEMQ